MTTTTYAQEPDAELVGWMSDLRQQSALDAALAKAMAGYRAQAVLDNDEEVQILPGEDTICVICEHSLPAGAKPPHRSATIPSSSRNASFIRAT